MATVDLAAMEQAMLDEHRKDREAFERMKRYMHKQADKGMASNAATGADSDDDGENSHSIIGKVESVFFEDVNEKWTVPKMLAHLRSLKFPLQAQKPEATLGLIFQKLRKRQKIKLIRRGSGSSPNVYRANVQSELDLQEKSDPDARGAHVQ